MSESSDTSQLYSESCSFDTGVQVYQELHNLTHAVRRLESDLASCNTKVLSRTAQTEDL